MNKGMLIAPLAALLLVACSDDGENGSNEVDSVVTTRAVAKGDATCAGGGALLESGLDTNRNGALDAAEVTSEYLQCLTAPRLRALHASPDAPRVNLRVNGVQALANVDYGQGSGFLNVADSTRVEVEAIIPGGNAVVLDRQLALDFSTDYTVLAVGEVADPIDTLVLSAPTARAIAAGNLRAQVVHAAPNAPAVDVYVTAPTAALASTLRSISVRSPSANTPPARNCLRATTAFV